MKALTLWAPYSRLLAACVKTVETRSWGTPYRGPVAIHEARKWDEEIIESIEEVRASLKRCWGLGFLSPAADRLMYATAWRDTLGRVLAVADLADCRPMAEAPNPQDALFGWYGPGRWGWVFPRATIRILPEPVAVRGAQGLWDLPPAVVASIEAQLQGATA